MREQVSTPGEWPSSGRLDRASRPWSREGQDSSRMLGPGEGGHREPVYSLNGLSSDLGHNGTFSAKVLIAQAQEVVDDQGCGERVEEATQVSRWRS